MFDVMVLVLFIFNVRVFVGKAVFFDTFCFSFLFISMVILTRTSINLEHLFLKNFFLLE